MTAKTGTERTAAHEARKIAAGARQTPRGLLPPESANALDALLKSGYAASQTGVIARALNDAYMEQHW